ncbi:hypothetical protein HMPREF1549_01610 [Actinomyces johnsonii F0510]|uniref:Uncharacterized protein n=1 Tax=Actinomyces johnsonii F0510 TaxID=1227262 RepID=U1Q8G0_9ACTO|nr:hypothetical protein HMPREF1549_01610 [Actinomyces johnsonii F0510]
MESKHKDWPARATLLDSPEGEDKVATPPLFSLLGAAMNIHHPQDD